MRKKEMHGLTETPEYVTWVSMKTRCYNENSCKYPDYGGRGITVCERWLNSFENFFADMGKRPSNKHSLDRFPDMNGNYEPTNCRWATIKEQSVNKRNVKLFEFNGMVKNLREWSDYTGLSYHGLYLRINRRGWSISDALSKKLRDNGNRQLLLDNPEMVEELKSKLQSPLPNKTS